jgi:hypothetical protein
MIQHIHSHTSNEWQPQPQHPPVQHSPSPVITSYVTVSFNPPSPISSSPGGKNSTRHETTMMMIRIVSLSCVVLAVAGIVAYAFARSAEAQIWAKPVPVLCCAAWLYSLGVLFTTRAGRLGTACATLAGTTFVLYGAGDVLLAVPGATCSLCFWVGGTCFWVGHFVLAAAAAANALAAAGSLVPAQKRRITFAIASGFAGQLGAVAVAVAIGNSAGSPTLGVLLWLYLSAFSVTAVCGCLWWCSWPAVACAVAGSAVFLASDAFLFVNKFGLVTLAHAKLAVMSTYWGGSALFCLAAITATMSPLGHCTFPKFVSVN